MADKSPYRIVHSARVSDTIISLADKAKSAGLGSAFRAILLNIAENLAERPEQWGDPLYSTAKPGGKVYRGYLAPFIVRYTVYPDEMVVFLWEVRLLPSHPLAADE